MATISKPSQISKISKPSFISRPSKASISKISLFSKPYKPNKSDISYPYKPSGSSYLGSSYPEPPIKPSKTPPPYVIYKSSKQKQQEYKQGVQTYRVLIKRFGKWIIVGEGLTKTEAIKVGRDNIKQGLGATFKIEKEVGKTKETGLSNMLDMNLGKEFRTYKVVKGRKIPLKDTFIQIKPMRLGTKGERREIQKERKKAKVDFNIFKKDKLKRWTL
jgi:hypothetical protein